MGRILDAPAWPKWAAPVALALYVLVYVLPLDVRPMTSPDEVRYAEISREMIASGNWVAPRFNGVRYFEKPILGYWLNSASFAAIGESEFSVRLPSALAAGLTALIVFFLSLSFVGRSSAYIASGIYLSTMIVVGVGTTAVFDTFLSLFLTGAMASYFCAYRASLPARKRMYLGICGAFCAAAFLTKGFLALAIPVIIVGPYLLARQDWRSLFTTSWLPIVVAACLVAPWAVLIHLREPDFWRYFFWVEHIQRFLGDSAQHKEPFWYFIVNGPFAALPWVALVPAAIVGFRHSEERSSLFGYSVAWAVMPFLFFSASNGKLLTYILPCFAPASILLAMGLERYFETGRRLAFATGSAILAALFALLIVAVILAQGGAFDQQLFAANEKLQYLGVLASFAVGLVVTVVALVARSTVVKLSSIGVAGVVLFLPVHVALLPQWYLDGKAPADYLAEELPVGPDAVLVSDAPFFGAVAWSFGRDDVYVVSEGEIAYGLSYPESRQRSLDDAGLIALVEENRNRHDVVVVCRESTAGRLPPAALARAQRKQRGEVVMFLIPAE